MIFAAANGLHFSIHGIESAAAKMRVAYLALKLSDPTRSHFQKWLKVMGIVLTDEDYEPPEIFEWILDPVAESCLTLAYLCLFDFLEAVQLLLENTPESIPFENEITLVMSPDL
jgi:hypothetical protein